MICVQWRVEQILNMRVIWRRNKNVVKKLCNKKAGSPTCLTATIRFYSKNLKKKHYLIFFKEKSASKKISTDIFWLTMMTGQLDGIKSTIQDLMICSLAKLACPNNSGKDRAFTNKLTTPMQMNLYVMLRYLNS